ncbi:MAG TPA: peptidase M16, partial [Lachnospiraceae bacterium]|nr:peptidase M16 [Lachnospiraceae bacterium]
MAKSIKNLDEVKIPEAYIVENSEYLKEADSFVIKLRHKLSNARVLVFSNEDDNKVFNISFRTPPKDDKGIPHIIEHTVLCGSKNFPVKDPFVELIKGSLNTFLNAVTYPDKTLYPVASCNNKDFENLMHVYMDAVFYPNIYNFEEIFKQEGWHY